MTLKPLPPGHDLSKDDDDRTPEPLSIGVPLTQLIKRKLVNAHEIVMLSRPRSLAAEKLRRLKTMLVNDKSAPNQVILVTSPSPSEGKSTIAMNLSLAFAADRSEKTLLIDADLRRPRIGDWLQPAPNLGLSEILTRRTGLDHVLIRLENSPLRVLPAGRGVEEPLDVLSSDLTRDFLSELRRTSDRIIIDTPPIVPFADADAVSALCDGLLMVARAGVTTLSMYQRAIASVNSTRLLGTVLNDAAHSLADWEQYRAEDYPAYYSNRRASGK